MENIEIVNSELQSEILSEQPSNGHCSNTQQNEIETVEVKKVEELISDEEIDLRYASSLDSETDGSWERPQQFALSLQKNVHVGPARAGRPKTARSLKFINKNKSTKFGFGYRPKSEIFEEQEKPVADNDVGNETDSDVSQEESDQNDAPVMKKRKLSQTAVPQRRSPRIANLKMAKSTTKNARSKSMTKDLEKTAAAMPKKRATRSRKRSRSNARSRSRSKSTRARKSSKASKSAPRKRRATKRRSRSMKK